MRTRTIPEDYGDEHYYNARTWGPGGGVGSGFGFDLIGLYSFSG